MAEEPTQATSSGGSTNTPTSRPHVDIKKRVGDTLAKSGNRVREAVVSSLVDTQLERRKSAILKAVEKLEAADKEIAKLRNQGVVSYDHEGKATGSPTFTKQQVEEIKKKAEEIGKLEGALAKALGDTPDFQKLFELTGENKG